MNGALEVCQMPIYLMVIVQKYHWYNTIFMYISVRIDIYYKIP